jgi:hypothetical protein
LIVFTRGTSLSGGWASSSESASVLREEGMLELIPRIWMSRASSFASSAFLADRFAAHARRY